MKENKIDLEIEKAILSAYEKGWNAAEKYYKEKIAIIIAVNEETNKIKDSIHKAHIGVLND